MKKVKTETTEETGDKIPVSRKDKVCRECAARVFSYLKTPQGLNGCSPAKVAEFRARAELTVPGGDK